MITKAIIEKIESDGYHVKVRIPVLHKIDGAPGATAFEDLPTALICFTPGCKPNLSVGDIVYVGFENNQMSEPVVLGVLLNNNSINSSASINADSLNVNVNAVLPQNQTLVGDLNVTKLADNTSLSLLSSVNNEISELKNNVNKLQVNYPIETGTNNGWEYIKYNDGTYEADKRLTVNTSLSTVSEKVFTTNPSTPFDFGMRPSFDASSLRRLTITFLSSLRNSAEVWYANYTNPSIVENSIYNIGTWILVSSKQIATVRGYLFAHIKGKWLF